MRFIDWILLGLAAAAVVAIWYDRRQQNADIRRLRAMLYMGKGRL
jgi:hypothetical protein